MQQTNLQINTLNLKTHVDIANKIPIIFSLVSCTIDFCNLEKIETYLPLMHTQTNYSSKNVSGVCPSR